MEKTHYKQEINITEGLMSRINELISYYPEDKENQLFACSHEVQDAHENWLSIELMDKVAEILYIKPIKCMVVSFYDVQPETRNTCSNFVKPHLVVEWCRRFDGLYL
jgi:NADH-quinone oxidoreductase subunit E